MMILIRKIGIEIYYHTNIHLFLGIHETIFEADYQCLILPKKKQKNIVYNMKFKFFLQSLQESCENKK